MKSSLFSTLFLVLGLTIAQAGHTAAISKSTNSKTALPAEKISLIEKAIYQQKIEG